LLTGKQTYRKPDKKTDKRWVKHNLLGGGPAGGWRAAVGNNKPKPIKSTGHEKKTL